MTPTRSMVEKIQWVRLGKIATVCTIVSTMYVAVTQLLLPHLTLLKGPEQKVQVVLQEAAPIIGWIMMPGLVVLVIWLFIRLVVPSVILAISVAWDVYEHGLDYARHGLVSVWDGLGPVAAKLAEPIGWSWLGFGGFCLVLLSVVILCALLIMVVFVPGERVTNEGPGRHPQQRV